MSAESQMGELCKKIALELLPKTVPIIPESITRIFLETFIGLLTEEQSSNNQLSVHIRMYYKDGIEYLSDAIYSERVVTRNEAIKQARDQFVSASNVEDALVKVKSQFYVGICYELQNERNLAKRWYEKAYTTAFQQATTLLQQPGRARAFITHRAGSIAGVILGGAIFGPPGIAVGRLIGLGVDIYIRGEQEKVRQRQVTQLYYFMKPLSQVLLAHGSTLNIAQSIETVDAVFYYDQGITLYNLRRYEEALSAFEQVLRFAPNSAATYNNKGLVLYNLKRYEEALSACEQALRLNPNSAATYNNKGLVLKSLKRYGEALQAIEQALRLDPNSAATYDSKGQVLNSLKRYGEALQAIEQALRLDPNYAEIYHTKGIALEGLGREKEAEQFYEQAKRLGYAP